MDAFLGVWFSSVLGAGAFATAGYVLGQRGVVVPWLHLASPSAPQTTAVTPLGVDAGAEPAAPEAPTPRTALPAASPLQVTPSDSERLPGDAIPTPPAFPAALAAAALPAARASVPPAPSVPERPTIIPRSVTPRSVPPPLPPARSSPAPEAAARQRELTRTRQELRDAQERADKASARAYAAEARHREIERQVEALRTELRDEVAARVTASTRAEELGDRLATASEDAAGLRHKVATLDRQAKQLREALQGRVRALTTSEWHRRRETEEAEEVRVKLRDVYEKLERSSLPPGSLPPVDPRRSSTPPASLAATRGSQKPDSDLEAEVARLREENRSLRTDALGRSAPGARRSTPTATPDIDLDRYRTMLEHVESVAGLRGAVIADELGSVVLGSGELADALAAFGAYIRDASMRTERLLPLDGVEEVDVRDREGMVLCTRLLRQEPSELSLVMIGAAEASIIAAKKVAEQRLRLRA